MFFDNFIAYCLFSLLEYILFAQISNLKYFLKIFSNCIRYLEGPKMNLSFYGKAIDFLNWTHFFLKILTKVVLTRLFFVIAI